MLDKYNVGMELKKAGVVAGGDMTTEGCATKLAYLFGRLGDNTAKVKEFLHMNLRGEMSPLDKYEKVIYTQNGNNTSKL